MTKHYEVCHILSILHLLWRVPSSLDKKKKKTNKKHWYAFDFIKLLCHNKGGGTHFTQVGAKLNRQMEAAAVPEQESNLETGRWVPLDRARLSGEFTVRPFHFGSLSDWAVTKAKGSHFSSCDCFLCVRFSPFKPELSSRKSLCHKGELRTLDNCYGIGVFLCWDIFNITSF